MIAKKILCFVSLVFLSLYTTGCSGKNTVFPNPDADIKEQIEKNKYFDGSSGMQVKKVMPYQNKILIEAGSRSNESKVVVNAGKVLKIYIAAYKMGGTMIAGHDVYTYVEKPGFIVGQTTPARATDGVITPSSKLPFKINKEELNINADEKELSNSDVKNFENNLHKKKYGFHDKLSKKTSAIVKERDRKLLDYINKLKEKQKELKKIRSNK